MAVHYTEAAETDLYEISVYTLTQWGEDQFDKYMTLLRATCEQILPRQHRLARSVPKRPGLFRWRCERHVIYFRRVGADLEIVRVLHDQMLPSNHL